MKNRQSNLKKNNHNYSEEKIHCRSFTLQSDADSILDKLNQSTVKILNDMHPAKSKVVEYDSDFQMRQKSYEIEKQKKLLQLKAEQLKNEQKQVHGKPKINKTQQIQEMINNYFEQSKNSKFGDLLLHKEKNDQIKGNLNQSSDCKQNFENSDPEKIATQTLESTKIYNDHERTTHKKSNSYIPIQERVKFIVQTKIDKIQEQKQQQQLQEEEYYASIPFQPLSAKSQNLKFNQDYTEEFFLNQIKWNQKKEQWIHEEQLKKQNETPKYTYRPTISPWPQKQKSVKRDFKQNDLSFQNFSRVNTEQSPQRNNKSFVFQTDIRIAKRKEREQQQSKRLHKQII